MSEDHIYAMAAGTRAVKIGRAWEPHSRLKCLQTAHYEKLTLEYVIGCTEIEALTVERHCHRVLRDRHISGEWFRISVDEARRKLKERAA
jgi:hypothetical protein